MPAVPQLGKLVVHTDGLFHPGLRDASVPAVEEAHAVARAQHLVQCRAGHGAVGDVEVHRLPHGERGHQVQRQVRDHPERAERQDHPVEDRGVVLPGQRQQVAVRGDEVDGPHRGGQRPVAVTGAVGARRARAADGDVGERPHGREGQTVLGRRDGQLPVAHPGRDPHGAGGGVELEVRRHRGQAHQRTVARRDLRERVPRAERSEPSTAAHERLQLGDRRRSMQRAGPVVHGAGPAQPGPGQRGLPRDVVRGHALHLFVVWGRG